MQELDRVGEVHGDRGGQDPLNLPSVGATPCTVSAHSAAMQASRMRRRTGNQSMAQCIFSDFTHY